MEYIFLAGVHGVGKSTLLNRINADCPIVYASVSDLIRKAGKKIAASNKLTDGIDENQQLWKSELFNLSVPESKILILDGHFSLINKDNAVERLSFDTFAGTNMNKIILKRESPLIIKERLEKRDNVKWDINKIMEFQKIEEEQAVSYSIQKGIPIFIFDQEKMYQELIDFITV
jgi:adenylate kinase